MHRRTTIDPALALGLGWLLQQWFIGALEARPRGQHPSNKYLNLYSVMIRASRTLENPHHDASRLSLSHSGNCLQRDQQEVGVTIHTHIEH